MVKQWVLLFFVLAGCHFLQSQEAKERKLPKDSVQTPVDSLRTDLKRQGVTLNAVKVKKRAINPLAPSKAAFYSAVLPGLGQIYNKRYWKAPIVWGAMGSCIAVYSFNNTQYKRFREAFKLRRAGIVDEFNDGVGVDFPDINVLEDQQERFQRDRDLWLVLTILAYTLNVIDANVDAHLKQYNVDEDLSWDIKPYIDMNQITTQANYGLALTVKF